MSAAEEHAVQSNSFDMARTHTVLRFAFGVTVAFIAAELLGWVPTFLPPALVGVVLVNVPIRPPPKVALGLILIIAVSALVAVLLSAAFRGAPAILFGVTALIVFLALHAVAKGAPSIGPLFMTICVTAIPVVGLESQTVAGSFAYALVRAMCFAVVVVWTTYLIWPKILPPSAAAKPTPLSQEVALRYALLGTAIVAPLMLVYLMFGLAHALPVLIATAMIVLTLDFNRGKMQAMAMVLANIAGGMVSLVLYLLVFIHPSLIALTLVVLTAGLAYGWRISKRDPMAAVALVAFNSTMIVFSSSLLSDGGSFSVWMTRLTQFVLAGAFTIGMMVLLWPRNLAQPEQPPAAPAN